MSREIKFRQFMGTRFRYWGFVNEGFSVFSSPVDKDMLSEQFTGLPDKNGVESWEGGSVRWGKMQGAVKFDTFILFVEGIYRSYQDNPEDAFS